MKAKYDVRNLQDYIVIFGEDKETEDLVEAELTNVLKEHGFEIRPEKIRRGENIEWCGITIESNGRIFPSKPHQLRLAFGSSEKAIDDLQTLDEVRH